MSILGGIKLIRTIKKEDKEIFYKLTELFYASEAVLQPIPKKHHVDAFEEMIRSDDYLQGYIFEINEKPVGYAITSKMYSQEAGGMTLWIDELFILKEYRSKGLGKQFFRYLKNNLASSVKRLRLEVEKDNEIAIKLYEKMGFHKLQYEQMYLEID